ncbi:MAG: aminotransferase class III-fold pyridoxal phosphate-dependent enzyme [Polyangiaceae bacterium]|nr:aminotransferase class III-fold pyridoxal phosphate-dependent enzyme [Polyangiaceae bacterium]
MPPANELALPQISESNAWYARARAVIPGATQTLAKGASQYVDGVAPKFLQRGKGCRVWDVDGNEFIDLTMAVGPLSLGYCYDKVDEAIRRQLEDGITFSLVHPLEVEVAELLKGHIPGAEMVRFSKTGCDVTSAAVRLARAFTGRKVVACSGYHGWHDWYIGTTPRNLGVPSEVQALTRKFAYNDLSSVRAILDQDVAAIILEPVLFEEPRDGFLQELRQLCTQNGTLLVFDEMWTGFRLGLGGAQAYFDVGADLACFSKAVANGMPLSVLSGRREIMSLLENDVFFYTTFGGEALSLAAAKATLQELRDQRVPLHLAEMGAKLQQGYNQLAEKHELPFTRCVGLPCRTLVTFDEKVVDPLLAKSLLQQELIRHGVLWTGFHNMSFSHQHSDVERILAGYDSALPVLARAVQKNTLRSEIQGTPVQPVFRKTQ